MPAYGLRALEVWPTVFGATMIVLGQLWRIDRFGLLFDELRGQSDSGSDHGAVSAPGNETA